MMFFRKTDCVLVVPDSAIPDMVQSSWESENSHAVTWFDTMNELKFDQ